MRLSEYLEPELVIIGLDTTGVEDTLAALLEHLSERGRLSDVDATRKALLDRERSHTTSLGNGVALPHATVAGVERAVILVATSPAGVPFGPVEGERSPDRLFFLLLSPLDAAGTHIKLLARIVRLVRSEEFVDKLIEADTGDALIEEIGREDALHV